MTRDNDTLAHEMLRAANVTDFHDGCAEPWVADVLAALVVANGTRTAVEIGSFQGRTSKRLVQALTKLPHDTQLIICEIDEERALQTSITIETLPLVAQHKVRFRIAVANSLDWIPALADDSVDFVWLDGNHEKAHVLSEIQELRHKLAPGGLLCGHDVFGQCDLQEIFAIAAKATGWRSMSLDFPKLGPAGGIGILQKPR